MKSLFFICFYCFAATMSLFGQAEGREDNYSNGTGANNLGYSESVPRRTVINRPKEKNDRRNVRSTPIKPEKDASKRRAEKKKPFEIDPETGEIIVEDDEIMTIESTLVSIPVSVYDKFGIYRSGLTAKNFKIFENGKEEPIEHFSTTEKPVTVILLIDTSPSTEYRIDEIRLAAQAFVDKLQEHDRVAVVKFDADVKVLAEATTDREKIKRAIRKTQFGNGTSLYSAVKLALGSRFEGITGRKAVVLFTDGVDTSSYGATYDSTLIDADESDAMIFPIYYNTAREPAVPAKTAKENKKNNVGKTAKSLPVNEPSNGPVYRNYLEDLADITGGRVFRPEAVPNGLNSAFEGIAEELRRQYNIGYYPSEKGKSGDRKFIKVRVDLPNLIVRTRDSYIVGTDEKVEM